MEYEDPGRERVLSETSASGGGTEDAAGLHQNSNFKTLSEVSVDSSGELVQALGDLPELERQYEMGEAVTYSQGLDSFGDFFKATEARLQSAAETFSSQPEAERTIQLEVCFSAAEDREVYTMAEEEGDVVRVPVGYESASFVHIAADLLDLEIPFRIIGYRGRKLIDKDLVLSTDDVVQHSSLMLNTKLALSKLCRCGRNRPGQGDLNPAEAVSAAIFFRLCANVSKLLPCPCGSDARLSRDEELENWYACVVEALEFIESLYFATPKVSGNFLNASYEGVHVQYQHGRLQVDLEEEEKTSLQTAAETVQTMFNFFSSAEEVIENEYERTPFPVEVISCKEDVLDVCMKMLSWEGEQYAKNWLCYNKIGLRGSDALVVSPLNAELRCALKYMDTAAISSLCGIPKAQLKVARVPIHTEIVALADNLAHAGGSVQGVPMIPRPLLLTGTNVHCRPRRRLESTRIFSSEEVSHSFKGRQRTISVTPSGAVIAFCKKTAIIKKVLRGVKQISVLGNGIGFDLSPFLSDDFSGDTELVNSALEWKYGSEVFHFVLSKIMTGAIRVQKKSPSASYVPESSKYEVGVVLYTMLGNRFWHDQTFMLCKAAPSASRRRYKLFWLPHEGFNYFEVVRKPDGLLRMVETESPPGERCFKCAVKFDVRLG